jgi:predicted transcriptional regulator
MSRAVVISVKQAETLEMLKRCGAVTASEFDRSALESLVERGYAIKHRNGTQATYTISASGKGILESL